MQIEDIDQILKLKFVPYGNTKKLEGPPFFDCEHSKIGCYANRIYACALYYIQR